MILYHGNSNLTHSLQDSPDTSSTTEHRYVFGYAEALGHTEF